MVKRLNWDSPVTSAENDWANAIKKVVAMDPTGIVDGIGAATQLRDTLGDLLETADGMDEGDPNRERIISATNDITGVFLTVREYLRETANKAERDKLTTEALDEVIHEAKAASFLLGLLAEKRTWPGDGDYGEAEALHESGMRVYHAIEKYEHLTAEDAIPF
jgi:hypothetical protein